MKTYTEDQLKAALVRVLLKKLIEDYVAEFDHQGVWWCETGKEVTPHEWPAIVGMVEDGLTKDQQWKYLYALAQPATHPFELYYDEVFNHVTAKWPIRAQALADIGAIKVEDGK